MVVHRLLECHHLSSHPTIHVFVLSPPLECKWGLSLASNQQNMEKVIIYTQQHVRNKMIVLFKIIAPIWLVFSLSLFSFFFFCHKEGSGILKNCIWRSLPMTSRT